MDETEKINFIKNKKMKSHAGTSGEKGTGFGMNIINKMALKLGAKLAVESKPGSGTKVSIYLN